MTLALLCFSIAFAFGQSDAKTAQVKEEVTAKERVLTFSNVYGDTKEDVLFFENKVNKAKMEGVISVTIDPKTQKFKARLEKNITKRALDHFFQAVGYTDYIISK